MKLTVPEAARRVGRNPETIRRWIWSGKLPSEKVGTQHLVDEEALERVARDPRGAASPPSELTWRAWAEKVRAFHGRFPPTTNRPSVTEVIRRTREGH